jgi:ligand-binding sensor domain-containing protein
MIRSCAAVLLLALSASPARPQIVRFNHLTVEDGLSQDIVSAITQDGNGFLWLGTEDGLNRFDGSTVTVFKHDPHDTSSLTGNDITALLPVRGGGVWIGTGIGADLFDPRTQAFSHPPRLPEAGAYAVHGFSIDADSEVWMASSRGLFRYVGGTFRHAVVGAHPVTRNVWALHIDGAALWYTDTDGLHRCALSHGSLEARPLPASLRVIAQSDVSQMVRDHRGNLWILTWDKGIFQFDSTYRLTDHFSTKGVGRRWICDNAARTGVEDGEGCLWFGTMSSLERYDPASGHITHFRGTSLDTQGQGMLGTRVYSLYVDRTGIVWIGTYRGGLNSYSRARLKFSPLVARSPSAPHDVFGIQSGSNGRILLGTERGLFVLSGSEPTVRWVRADANDGRPVYTIFREGDTVWAGSDGSIRRLDRHLRPVSRIQLPVHDAVRSMVRGPDGLLWVGTELRGLYRLVGPSRFNRWEPPGFSFHDGVWALQRDSFRRLWIGTWNSAYSFRVDSSNGKVLRYGDGPGADVALQFPAFRTVREDADRGVWLASWGGGIYHLDSLGHPDRHFTEVDGLASDFVKSLEVDRHGVLWIGTERGLAQFDPSTQTFRTYTQADGLPSTFFYSGASFKDRNGRLFFGTNNGLVAFDPDRIPVNATPPLVAITAFRVFDKPVKEAPGTAESPEPMLAYDQNFISFDYVALDYTSPQRNQYAYKLDGVDRLWVQAGTRQYAAYTHLDAGTYTFHVKACNSDGVWNDVGASMTLVITPPVWSTWWFRLLSALLALFAVYALYRYRVHRLLEVERLRRRIARDLHDDIGTNLSAMVLASQVAGQQSLPQSVQSYVASMSALARETQEQMRNIVWMLNPKNDSPQMFLTRMKDEAARLLRDIPYTFEGPPRGLTAVTDIELKRHLFLIFKEALNNTARHSAARRVRIILAQDSGVVDLDIRDDGKGFDLSAEDQGNGIDNMRARAGQLGAEFEIESQIGHGTRVHLKMKIP